VILQRKNLVPTVTGIGLIDTIQNDLLKSAELTGKWEKNLRGIELGTYDVKQFMWEMKTMVSKLVQEVKKSNFSKIDVHDDKKPVKKAKPANDAPIKCPKCNEGKILKGKTAYGCSNFKNGCNMVVSFVQQGKKLTDAQLKALFIKSRTPEVKGVVFEGKKQNGFFVLEKDFSIQFRVKEEVPLICPKCKKGKMLKGNNAYGCAEFRNGCNFVVPFLFGDKKLTEKQIETLIRKGKTGKIKDLGTLVLGREFKVEQLL
jgi:DNA topoisomerase-3